MKLQFTDGALRIRVDEAELARLRDGATLRLSPRLVGRELFRFELALGEPAGAAAGEGAHRVLVPADMLDAYAATLPRRDALALGRDDDGLHLEFEVDVRDSIAVRGPKRRP